MGWQGSRHRKINDTPVGTPTRRGVLRLHGRRGRYAIVRLCCRVPNCRSRPGAGGQLITGYPRGLDWMFRTVCNQSRWPDVSMTVPVRITLCTVVDRGLRADCHEDLRPEAKTIEATTGINSLSPPLTSHTHVLLCRRGNCDCRHSSLQIEVVHRDGRTDWYSLPRRQSGERLRLGRGSPLDFFLIHHHHHPPTGFVGRLTSRQRSETTRPRRTRVPASPRPVSLILSRQGGIRPGASWRAQP